MGTISRSVSVIRNSVMHLVRGLVRLLKNSTQNEVPSIKHRCWKSPLVRVPAESQPREVEFSQLLGRMTTNTLLELPSMTNNILFSWSAADATTDDRLGRFPRMDRNDALFGYIVKPGDRANLVLNNCCCVDGSWLYLRRCAYMRCVHKRSSPKLI